MENLSNQENREKQIYQALENLAVNEGVEINDFISDMITFAEIIKSGDDDARPFFEEISDETGVGVDELMDYIIKKKKEYMEDVDEI